MADGGGETEKLEILRCVYRISRDLQRSCGSSSTFSTSDSKAVLELRTASDLMLTFNPLLFSLSSRIRLLSDSIEELQTSKPRVRGVVSFLAHRLKSLEVSRLASEIESELQGLIDRQLLLTLREILVRIKLSPVGLEEEEHQLYDKMSLLQERLTRGFDREFQDLLLRSGIFLELEWVLGNLMLSQRVREKAAVAIKELLLFNKDVFVGSVLIGGILRALVSMGSCCSLLVLSSLIKAIRSPLVDELEASGCILDIVGYLSSGDVERRATALLCVMQIGYFGRKEAIESLIKCGLIRRLVDLQRIETECRGKKNKMEPFSTCVARFVMQLEVGEGLRNKEKRDFKLQILHHVKDACDSDAESMSIMAEVLWCSCP